MVLSMEQANQALAYINTEAELRELISQLDITASGDVTILYGGDVTDVIHSTDVINDMLLTNQRIRVLDNTEAARFLDFNTNTIFEEALERILESNPRTKGSIANQFLQGSVDADGIRIPNGAWDDISGRFVAETVGEVRVIVPNADPYRVFAQTELPLLLDNPDVTSIDGIPKDELIAIRNKAGGNISAVFEHVRNTSLMQVVLSDLQGGHYQDFLAITPDKMTEIIAADPAKASAALEQAFNTLDDAEAFKTWSRNLIDIGEDLAVKSGKVLNKLGPLGAMAGFMLATSQANAAEQAGDHELAIQILEDYAVDTAGSFAGESIGAALGTMAIGVLAVAGVTVSAPLAAVIIIGASITGGIFGSNTASDFHKSLSEMNDEQKLDIFKRMKTLLFGEGSTINSVLNTDLASSEMNYIDLNTDLQQAQMAHSQITSQAKDNIAWRYALRELNPFVVTGADYEQHNSDGSLALYDPQTDTGNLSEHWIESRAAFLVFNNLYRDEDGSDGTYEIPLEYSGSFTGNFHFMDRMNDQDYDLQVSDPRILGPIRKLFFGGDEADNESGGEGSDQFFGGKGNDTFYGHEGHDLIEGGDNDDILDGGKDNDTLIGGKGNDTYQFHSGGDGHDTLIDSDGQGNITFDGETLSGGKQVQTGGNVYQSGDKKYTFIVDGDLTSASTLLIQTPDGTITVNHFVNGMLGITLGAAAPPVDNTNYSTLTLTAGNDWVYDTNGSDEIYALGGNDKVFTRGGSNDVVYGGPGMILSLPRRMVSLHRMIVSMAIRAGMRCAPV